MAPVISTISLVLMFLFAASGNGEPHYFSYDNTCQDVSCPDYIMRNLDNRVYQMKAQDNLWAYSDTGSCESGSWDDADSQGAEAIARFFTKYNLSDPSVTAIERSVPLCERPMSNATFPCCTFPHRHYARITCEELRESNAALPEHDEVLGVSLRHITGCPMYYSIFFNSTASPNETANKYKEITAYLDDNACGYVKTIAFLLTFRDPMEKVGYSVNRITVPGVTDQVGECKDPHPVQ